MKSEQETAPAVQRDDRQSGGMTSKQIIKYKVLNACNGPSTDAVGACGGGQGKGFDHELGQRRKEGNAHWQCLCTD